MALNVKSRLPRSSTSEASTCTGTPSSDGKVAVLAAQRLSTPASDLMTKSISVRRSTEPPRAAATWSATSLLTPSPTISMPPTTSRFRCCRTWWVFALLSPVASSRSLTKPPTTASCVMSNVPAASMTARTLGSVETAVSRFPIVVSIVVIIILCALGACCSAVRNCLGVTPEIEESRPPSGERLSS